MRAPPNIEDLDVLEDSLRAPARASKGRSRTSSFFSIANKPSATALMLLVLSSHLLSIVGAVRTLKQFEDFAGDVALQAAQNLSFR
jgi:hypothetical protein